MPCEQQAKPLGPILPMARSSGCVSMELTLTAQKVKFNLHGSTMSRTRHGHISLLLIYTGLIDCKLCGPRFPDHHSCSGVSRSLQRGAMPLGLGAKSAQSTRVTLVGAEVGSSVPFILVQESRVLVGTSAVMAAWGCGLLLL